ncbi:hypothetical protein Tco_0041710, partial [Tanacetum coccineum]
MTIDKSWTTISNRNSDAFLDGLFAFIKHCEPLLHPITRKIRCPCSHGFDQHYTIWKYHGEPILPLPLPVPHSPEHIDMDAFFEDISANNVPTPPTQTTGPQPAQTTGPNNEFEELLSRSTQKLYPGCDMTTLEFTSEISHIKVVEHVYHRDVAESDQDVIHGSSSSHVTLSVGLTCLEHTDLSINAQSTEVDAPPVNEDNADFINNEDDVVAHVLDDDDVEVSDDDEVNPSTNVEEVLSSDDSDDDN